MPLVDSQRCVVKLFLLFIFSLIVIISFFILLLSCCHRCFSSTLKEKAFSLSRCCCCCCCYCCCQGKVISNLPGSKYFLICVCLFKKTWLETYELFRSCFVCAPICLFVFKFKLLMEYVFFLIWFNFLFSCSEQERDAGRRFVSSLHVRPIRR